jgi:2-aminoadipate transaminase
VLVTSGGVEAVELVGKVFLDRRDAVVVEAPTYLASIMGFKGYEARIVGVPMDDEGLDTELLAEQLEAGLRPKLLYAIPDFQNPTGLTLAAERRTALVELARRHGFLVVEDVTYRELAFPDEEQPPTLRSLAPDVVLQIGTFSKTLFPGVRLGWAAGPAEVVERLVWAKQNTDQCAGALGQRLLEEYGRRGLLDEQIGRSRRFYAGRARLTLAALERYMPEGTRWTKPRGGFFAWLTLKGDVDTTSLAEQAMDEGVAFVPGRPFFADGSGRDAVRLAFSRVADGEIDEGLERLGRLFGRALARRG